nr:hypothetical protein [Tanacetum cinerariifolium]
YGFRPLSMDIFLHDTVVSCHAIGSSGLRCYSAIPCFFLHVIYAISLSLYPFTERYAQPYFFSCLIRQDPAENSSQSPPQIDHHCCYGCGNSLEDIFCQRCTCKSCGKGAHYGYNCPPKVLIISNPKPCHDQNVEEFPQTLPSSHPTCYFGDEKSFAYDSTPNLVKDSPNVFNPPSQPSMYSYVFCGDDAHYSYDCPPQVLFIYDPKPDIIISKLPPCIAITPVVSIKDSLIMRDERLDTIPGKESDEFIKYSVKNLIPNPSKSENEHSSIISSSKIDSLLDEFVGELILLKSIPQGIDEADCDHEEEIHLIEKLLYDNSAPRPPEEFIYENSDAAIEAFSPSPIPVEDSDSLKDEIDLSLTLDDSMPLGIKDDDYDSEGDILILEEFLSNDSLSLSENKSFHFNIPSSPRPPAKPRMMMKLSPIREF